MLLLLAACGSGVAEQTQVVSVTPTSVATTAPLSVPTVTPVPTPTSTAVPQATSTPLPTVTAAPTPTLEPAPSPAAASDDAVASTDATAEADPAEVIETPTPVATPIETPIPTSTPEAQEDDAEPAPIPTEAPTTAVAATGEAPVECYDPDVKVYRGFVDGVDALSFEGGRVFCTGAGTNNVSAALSYRHFIHFCMNGQPASAPVRADRVPTLLVVIDSEAQRQLAQGASAPAGFTGSGTQC